MKTYEMIALADKNGRTYISGNNSRNMRYNKELGFHDAEGDEWGISAFRSLNTFINLNEWKEYKKNLTKQQIIDILGYDFEIVG